jgi:FAD synthase
MALRSIASLEPAAGHPQAELRAILRAHPAAGVVTIGTFDGVHAGHRALIARAASEAKARSMPLGAITFSPRPDTVVSSQPALPDICTLDQRIGRLHAAGADDVIVIPFTRSLMQLTARQFVGCLIEELGVHALVVGDEFALGRGREGTVPALRQLGLKVVAFPVLRPPGQHAKISSSAIRRTMAAGTPAALALA